MEASDKFVVRVITTSDTEESAKIVAEQASALLTVARNALDTLMVEPAANKLFDTYRRFAQELLENARVERDGTEVRVQAESTVELPDLAEAFLGLGL
jgi:hypothetical protein